MHAVCAELGPLDITRPLEMPRLAAANKAGYKAIMAVPFLAPAPPRATLPAPARESRHPAGAGAGAGCREQALAVGLAAAAAARPGARAVV